MAENEKDDCIGDNFRHIVGIGPDKDRPIVYDQVELKRRGGIRFTYCPMCGKKFEEEENGGN